ncbi:hypothetical protein [Kitasatospora sp. MBT63]|uniref:hypothetical protein n=1 Tax=Kitasatospora sp. MBT63 TaxID=1444768 RepID=UPI0005399713|nr:hypothetical protein [Kitasatospora sp. MBT63]
MNIWPRGEERRDLVLPLNLRPGGPYITLECQLGAHHACPGGLRTETQTPMSEYWCRCGEDGCSCPLRQQAAW